MLNPDEAKRFYDRFGTKQDRQGFYEDRALDELIEASRLEEAQAVVEFGCGTGRLATRLLDELLPTGAKYTGFDISTTMVSLAEERLEPFGDRATVSLTEGSVALPLPDGCCDRFISTYVLDLLPEQTVRECIEEARRLLVPEGLLCLTGITYGSGPLSHVTMSIWRALHRLRPHLVGGCRPIRLQPFITPPDWSVLHHATIRVTYWHHNTPCVIILSGAN